MDQVHSLFGGRSGVYPVPRNVAVAEVERAAQQRGFRFFRVNGQHAANRQELFGLLRTTFEFPAHFGSNWDALLDMLRDLSWLPASGYVVLIENLEPLSTHDHASYDKLLGVLHDATAFWADRMHNQRPMIVLLADLTASNSA